MAVSSGPSPRLPGRWCPGQLDSYTFLEKCTEWLLLSFETDSYSELTRWLACLELYCDKFHTVEDPVIDRQLFMRNEGVILTFIEDRGVRAGYGGGMWGVREEQEVIWFHDMEDGDPVRGMEWEWCVASEMQLRNWGTPSIRCSEEEGTGQSSTQLSHGLHKIFWVRF